MDAFPYKTTIVIFHSTHISHKEKTHIKFFKKKLLVYTWELRLNAWQQCAINGLQRCAMDYNSGTITVYNFISWCGWRSCVWFSKIFGFPQYWSWQFVKHHEYQVSDRQRCVILFHLRVIFSDVIMFTSGILILMFIPCIELTIGTESWVTYFLESLWLL